MSKLIFKNTVGKIYDDKIVIDRNRIFFESLLDIDLIKHYEKSNRLYLFLLPFLIIFNIVFVDFFKNYICATIFFYIIFFLVTFFYKRKIYFIKVVVDDFQSIDFKIKRSLKKDAKVFIKEVNFYLKT